MNVNFINCYVSGAHSSDGMVRSYAASGSNDSDYAQPPM
jgi:hypothetical protein